MKRRSITIELTKKEAQALIAAVEFGIVEHDPNSDDEISQAKLAVKVLGKIGAKYREAWALDQLGNASIVRESK